MFSSIAYISVIISNLLSTAYRLYPLHNIFHHSHHASKVCHPACHDYFSFLLRASALTVSAPCFLFSLVTLFSESASTGCSAHPRDKSLLLQTSPYYHIQQAITAQCFNKSLTWRSQLILSANSDFIASEQYSGSVGFSSMALSSLIT